MNRSMVLLLLIVVLAGSIWGCGRMRQEEDMLYLLQGYGIQSSGGYSIRVEKVSENDTELHVKTKLIGPKGKDGGTEGISCPYLVIKVENRHKKVVFD